MTRRLFVLFLTLMLVLSVFSVFAAAEEETETTGSDASYSAETDGAFSGYDPDAEAERIYTADDNIYEKSAYDKFGWAVWIIVGGFLTVAVIFISKYLERKVR